MAQAGRTFVGVTGDATGVHAFVARPRKHPETFGGGLIAGTKGRNVTKQFHGFLIEVFEHHNQTLMGPVERGVPLRSRFICSI